MPKKAIQLSDHFTYSRLLRFVLPCIGTMLFTSIYGIVDGLCVSNFVGKTAFAAKALLPQAGLAAGGQTGSSGNGLCGVGGAGEGRVQNFVNVQAAVPDKRAQLPRLLLPAGGQRAVCHAADLIFHVPYRLAVAGEIDIMHKITPYSLCRVPSGSRQTVSPSSMPRRVSSLSG